MCTIRWIGQSGYILSDGTTEICIDPYLSDVVNRVANRSRLVKAPIEPEEIRSEVVICTHNHLDHTDTDAIPRMNQKDILFLAPTDAKSTLSDCGVQHYQPFDEGAEICVGDFQLRAVYAAHSVPAVGVLVKRRGLTLYFSGDTEYDTRLEALAEEQIDIMFICINGKLGNMDVADAVRLTHILRPRLGVPSHYGMFASNTEDPIKYTSQVEHGFAMVCGRTYDITELLAKR